MTWKHVALVALAVALVTPCVLSATCMSNPIVFAGVLQLASVIVAGAVGNAMRSVDDTRSESYGRRVTDKVIAP